MAPAAHPRQRETGTTRATEAWINLDPIRGALPVSEQRASDKPTSSINPADGGNTLLARGHVSSLRRMLALTPPGTVACAIGSNSGVSARAHDIRRGFARQILEVPSRHGAVAVAKAAGPRLIVSPSLLGSAPPVDGSRFADLYRHRDRRSPGDVMVFDLLCGCRARRRGMDGPGGVDATRPMRRIAAKAAA